MLLAQTALLLIVAANSATAPAENASAPLEGRPLRVASAIVNGVPTQELPSVALLAILGADGVVGTCTGTLIGCNTILTAAHCFCNNVPGPVCFPEQTKVSAVLFQHLGILIPTSVTVHPGWTGSVAGGHDLALVGFKSSALPIRPSRINTLATVPAGVEGLIAGYGRTGGTTQDAGIKRAGLIRSSTCPFFAPPSSLCWSFEPPLDSPGTDSNTCHGDSGGPLFVFDTQANPFVAGVTSSGLDPSCLAPNISFDADVYAHRQWIVDASFGDAGAATTACSVLPEPGSPAAPSLAFSGTLGPTNTEEYWKFDVAPNTALLTVVLNGERPLINDFELSLFPPGATTPTCFPQDASSAESCLEIDPPPGQWIAGVQRFQGAGDYQLTTTLYGAPSSGEFCLQNATNLCLTGGRFRVAIDFRTAGVATQAAWAEQLTPDTGYFWFFDANNVEVVLKVLNACPINGRFWVFAGGLTNVEALVTVTDTATGIQQQYFNPLGQPFQPIQDTEAFATCGASALAPTRMDLLETESRLFSGLVDALSHEAVTVASSLQAELEAEAACTTTATKLCVAQDRFEVEVDFATGQGSGVARTVKLTNDTGYFWYFNQSNIELVVKVLNGCGLNARHWVFAGGLTDTETTIRVRDTNTGATQAYFNPLGTPFSPIQDTQAFKCP
jgi:hypothetical protein